MANIKIESNASDLVDKLSAIAGKQLPFVTAKTLTGVAFDVRDEESRGLDRYFKLRTAWTRKSIKVIRAEKRDFPNAASIVGVRDKVLAANITGGTRRPDGDSFGVPVGQARRIINPGKETLGPPRFPGRLLGGRRKFFGNKPFLMRTKNGKQAVAVRETKKRTPLQLLYVFKDQVTTDKKWPLIDNAKRIVNKTYKAKFRKNLLAALR